MKYLKLITEKNIYICKNLLLPFLHRKLTNVAITGDKMNINVLPYTAGNGMLTYGERINIFLPLIFLFGKGYGEFVIIIIIIVI